MGVKFNIKELYKELTEKVINIMKQGKIPWEAEWLGYGFPVNGFSGNQYSGWNRFFLSVYQRINAYSFPAWFTFWQIKQLGGRVKKNAKGVHVHYIAPYEPKTKRSMCRNCENVKKCSFPDKTSKDKIIELCENYQPVWKVVIKSYCVFNYDQTENIPIEKVKGINFLTFKKSQDEEYYWISQNAKKKIKKILEAYIDKPLVIEQGNKAFYNKHEDYIQLPKKSQFFTEDAYYATLFHELVHSTGYEKRLNRKSLMNCEDNHEYSYEELVAELGAFFLCYEAEISSVKRLKNTAGYIQSWMSVLQNNPAWIWKAAREAERACQYIFNSSQKNSIQKAA